ncbi:MAG TPA: MerR family transcriptional regulator [Acidobacteriota bacterium]|nr:MerR family transcriptional regulator [Acidobacteriota bacterium]
MAYTIGDISESTGLSRHTLRYYERAGLLPPVSRDGGGRRCYDERDLRWLRFLMRLREAGMPIATIRRYVQLLGQGETSLPQRIELLDSHRQALRAKIQRLQNHLDAVDAKLDLYRREGVDCLAKAND